jgi:hypothetical protein
LGVEDDRGEEPIEEYDDPDANLDPDPDLDAEAPADPDPDPDPDPEPGDPEPGDPEPDDPDAELTRPGSPRAARVRDPADDDAKYRPRDDEDDEDL